MQGNGVATPYRRRNESAQPKAKMATHQNQASQSSLRIRRFEDNVDAIKSLNRE
jgi:hypothetical protein